MSKIHLKNLIALRNQHENDGRVVYDKKTESWEQWVEILHCSTVLSHKHTERQRQRHFEVLTLGLMLGYGSGTDFQASQGIPMGPCRLTRRLTLGVFIPLIFKDTPNFEKIK